MTDPDSKTGPQTGPGTGTRRPAPSRRRLLGLAGVAGVAAASGAAGASAILHQDEQKSEAVLPRTVSPYGAHQAGITQPMPRAVRLLALDLLEGIDPVALARLMRLWTGDIAALAAGRPAPGDTAPDLAQGGSDLTITVGWGRTLFDKVGLSSARPTALNGVPPMRHDRLQARWSGGDLLLVVAADDDTAVNHAVRRLLLDAQPFARRRWEQLGSWRGRDEQQRPVTGRNLFGQVDGTGNPEPGTPLFDETVWTRTPEWFAGGTTLVVRRIAMRLDAWDELTRHEQERAIGRDLARGAPLSGTRESDPLDLQARDDRGDLLIPLGAHARLAHPSQNAGLRVFRKGANYAEPGSAREAGLIFLSHQADIGAQFTPLQQRLDEMDDLNTWTTAVGSAEFALLPGFTEQTWLGQSLLG